MAENTATITDIISMTDNYARNCSLTDLHTHILPGVDDGAASLEDAQRLLRAQKAKGVDRVALTSHFYPLRQDLDAFLEKRQRAYELLLTGWDPDAMPQLQLGAEVHYCVTLADIDLHRLTIGQGRYLLLELSDTTIPAHIERVLQLMLEQEIRPILAHVERCVYFREEPERLVRLVEAGALAQLSASAFAARSRRKFAKICLERDAAHIIASDIHNVGEDKAWLCSATKTLSEDACARAEAFAKAVWENGEPPACKVSQIKRTLFGYG